MSPVVEAEYELLPFDWAPSKSSKAFVEHNDRSPDADVALVEALLASYNDITSSETAEEVIRAVMKPIL